jgi:hypothetical protein
MLVTTTELITTSRPIRGETVNGAVEIDTLSGVVWSMSEDLALAVAEIIAANCRPTERDLLAAVVMPLDDLDMGPNTPFASRSAA